MNELQARFFARRGYVYAVQDCRGRFSSPGVGMIGASYLGWVQWWAAREYPPHLVSIISNV